MLRIYTKDYSVLILHQLVLSKANILVADFYGTTAVTAVKGMLLHLWLW